MVAINLQKNIAQMQKSMKKFMIIIIQLRLLKP